MMRKTIIALFALAAVGLIQPTAASARGGGLEGGVQGNSIGLRDTAVHQPKVRKVVAARRNPGASRDTTFRVFLLSTFPPEMSLCGQRPSQEVKWRTVAHGRISVPISERTVWMVAALQPSMAVKSTPTIL